MIPSFRKLSTSNFPEGAIYHLAFRAREALNDTRHHQGRAKNLREFTPASSLPLSRTAASGTVDE
jgi:hypothetical protein